MSPVRRAKRRILIGLLLVMVPVGALGLACGASQSAIYEGDVRFEHCMALDSRPEVKPTIRRACWEEWNRFYIFGQTRDRVQYARDRINQLRGEGDFEVWSPPEERKSIAVPEPTSALAPPPMMFETDAGAPPPPPPPATGAAAVDGGAPPGGECATECEEAWRYCKEECEGATCEKACAGKHKRCMRRCY